MSTRHQKDFEDREAELYLALEQVLEEMSESTQPQQKLADEVGTLLANHFEEFGLLQDKPSGEVEIRFKRHLEV